MFGDRHNPGYITTFWRLEEELTVGKLEHEKYIKTLLRRTLMKTFHFPTTACRVCRYYQPQGRRGGVCDQLGVPVRASWKACSLALPPFTASWEKMEVIWQEENQLLKEALSVNCSLGSSEPSHVEEAEFCNSCEEHLTADKVLV
jgi:hypothetical protein